MTGFVDLTLKFPVILTISVFMWHLNLMLRRVEHEKVSGVKKKKILDYLPKNMYIPTGITLPSEHDCQCDGRTHGAELISCFYA